ncbi:MAG: hypothetical protein AB7T63_15330 [Planctomycetota bacterium]
MRRLLPWLPLFVLSLPLAGPWLLVTWWREGRGRKARGRRVLTPTMETIVLRLVEESITTSDDPVPLEHVVDNVDRYLADREPTRRWRIPFGLLLVDVAVWTRTGRRVAQLDPARGREVLRRLFDEPRSPWARLGRLRQLVRLAYYAHPSAQQWMGFVPFDARTSTPRPTRVPSVADLPVMEARPLEVGHA